MRKNVEIDKISEYTGHKGSIYAIAGREEEGYFFSAGDDGVVARWELHSETQTGKGVFEAVPWGLCPCLHTRDSYVNCWWKPGIGLFF